MSPAGTFDVAIIGGGIVGLAAARALLRKHSMRIAVVEAEQRLAMHQTGHNSGVIHSGLYYPPDSRKARDCVAGRDAMYEFCRTHGIAHESCGKLVVAASPTQLEGLAELERRGRANGLAGIKRLEAGELREYEPHVRAHAGLWVPQTGIVDFSQVAEVLARRLRERDVDIHTGARVTRVARRPDAFLLRYGNGELLARNLINCGGLQSDRIARMCGLSPGLRIVPFRGEYHRLAAHRVDLVRNLIYTVPEPGLPFLGVHFTRKIHGGVQAGPNALLSMAREGYRGWSFSARDVLATLTYGGFWRMVAKHWRAGLGEMHRSLSTKALVRELRAIIPDLSGADLRRDASGIRAQAVSQDGSLVDDFRVLEAERMLHVLNAPSPAATAALAIGDRLVRRAETCLALD